MTFHSAARLTIFTLLACAPLRAAPAFSDTLNFGDDAAEKAHDLAGERSEVVKGGLDLAARRLLPLAVPEWQGEKMAFTMKVDPALPNYFTVRLWGSDVSPDKLGKKCPSPKSPPALNSSPARKTSTRARRAFTRCATARISSA